GPPAAVTTSSQAKDDQGVVGHRLAGLEELAQALVVAARGHLEPALDRGALGSRLGPPAALEVEDRPVPIGERHPPQPANPAGENQALRPRGREGPRYAGLPPPVWRSW